jgi:hypothetical protein
MDTNISLNKEYALYADNNYKDYQTQLDTIIEKSNTLRLNTYQLFIKHLLDPSSDINKLLLIHGTGTGKTLSSLAVASQYIKQYKEYKSNDIRYIVIIGFTHDIFKRELLSHPEFGFITSDELNELKELSRESINSKLYDEKRNSYMRRFKLSSYGGIFKFIGYKQLFLNIINNNQLLEYTKKTGIKNISTNLLKQLIEDGIVDVNYEVINDFKNSLLICDEIHNVYNSDDQNSWGCAIEMIIDYFNDKKKINTAIYNSIRILYLSATPLTSGPTEIVSIINLLNNEEDRIVESDIFISNSIKLKPIATKLIESKINGKISYLMDANPERYPIPNFVGQSLDNMKYLKFNQCIMKSYQLNTYNKYINKEYDIDNTATNTMIDIIYPNPDNDTFGIPYYDKLVTNRELGIKKIDNNITGEFLLEDNISKYSSKYFEILKKIKSIQSNEKIFIYHPYVYGSGVNLISNMLSMNGFLNEVESSNNNSICYTCGVVLKDHKDTKHEFSPIRYTTITGYLSKGDVNKLLTRFNSDYNTNGNDIKILIGSRTMRESHTLKSIRHLIISHIPSNISEMIQIIGRVVRKNSHILLPNDQRNVKIYIYTTSLPSGLSIEEENYKLKLDKYIQINKIENILFNVSIDYLINFKFNSKTKNKLIGEVFDQDYKKYKVYQTNLKSLTNIKYDRFNAFFIEDEIDAIKIIIKRIFLEYQKILTYDILFELIKSPPFTIYLNTSLFSKQSFAVALNELIFTKTDIDIIQVNTNSELISIIDPNTKIIINSNGDKFIIIYEYGLYIIYNMDSYINNNFDINGIYVNTEYNSTYIEDNISLYDTYNNINNLINIDNILKSISSKFSNIENLDILSYEYLIQHIIKQIWNKLFKNITITNSNLLLQILKFYLSKGIIITLNDCKNTIIEPIISKYLNNIGPDWNKLLDKKKLPNKINLLSLPIGYYISTNPKLLDINTMSSWNEYSYIIPYKKMLFKKEIPIIIIEEINNHLQIIHKVIFVNDPNSKGININFITKEKLNYILESLQLKIPYKSDKIIIGTAILDKIKQLESNERKINSKYKLYYKFYEKL